MVKQSSKQDGRPAFMFFPSDWLSSPDLNSCSLEAQGLWIKMLCIMYQSPERGVLLLSSGKQIDNKTLAKICGTDEQTINKLLAELEDAGVFSRLDNQAIYNRRMYREGKISEARSKAGSWERKQQKSNKRATKVEQNAETVTVTETVTEYESIDKDEDYKEEEKEFFEDFWNLYPKRGNKKVGKKECWDFMREKIKREEWENLLTATKNYAMSNECKNGYARDPIRFLKKDYWKDWVDITGKIRFDEDKQFICVDCKIVKEKIEREYGEDGKGRCRSCHKKYLEHWEKEQETTREKLKQDWEGMTEEQRRKMLENYKKLNIPIPDWMVDKKGGKNEKN